MEDIRYNVLVIIINYACEKEIIQYCKQIEMQKNSEKIGVCIVDNKVAESREFVLKNEVRSMENVFYYVSHENLGYLNGALFGMKNFKSQFKYLPEWIAISNTDIVFTQQDFFYKFLSIEYDKDIWNIGPSVLSKKGYCNPQYYDRVPLKKINRLIRIFKSPFLAKLYLWAAEIKAKKRLVKPESQYVYGTHGCFFFIKNEFIESLGDEQYGVMLYSEESFISEFVEEKHKKSYYEASIELFHDENLSTGKLKIEEKGKYISESLKYIKDRFYS